MWSGRIGERSIVHGETTSKEWKIQCCGSGIQCFFDPWIGEPDSGWKKKKSGPGSGMNISYHFSESLETIFWVKNTRIRIRDLFYPGSGMKNSDPRSGINIPDPQHWKNPWERKYYPAKQRRQVNMLLTEQKFCKISNTSQCKLFKTMLKVKLFPFFLL